MHNLCPLISPPLSAGFAKIKAKNILIRRIKLPTPITTKEFNLCSNFFDRS
jgi:hypothetical protein